MLAKQTDLARRRPERANQRDSLLRLRKGPVHTGPLEQAYRHWSWSRQHFATNYAVPLAHERHQPECADDVKPDNLACLRSRGRDQLHFYSRSGQHRGSRKRDKHCLDRHRYFTFLVRNYRFFYVRETVEISECVLHLL